MSDSTDTRLGASRWHTGSPSQSWDSTPGASRGAALVLCGLFAVQFLLGIYLNLYINLPPVTSSSGGLERSMMGRFGTMFSPGRPVLTAHIMLCMLLVVVGVFALVIAASSGNRFAIGWSASGLVGLLVAGYGGISFLMFGHNNLDSYLMAVGFLVSFTAYLVGAVRNSASGPPSMRTRQARAEG